MTRYQGPRCLAVVDGYEVWLNESAQTVRDDARNAHNFYAVNGPVFKEYRNQNNKPTHIRVDLVGVVFE